MRKLQADLEKRIRVRNKYVKELANIKGVIVPFADNTEFVSNAFEFPNAKPEKTDWHYDRNELYPANEPAIPEPYKTYDKCSDE